MRFKPSPALRLPFWAILVFGMGAGRARGDLSGPPITDNNYRVDLTQGAVVGPSRMTAMGGAYTSIAEGAAGLAMNPAAAAFRAPASKGWWDWDFTVGAFTSGRSDFNNFGSFSSSIQKNNVTDAGLLLQGGRFGFGVFGVSYRYDLQKPQGATSVEFGATRFAFGGAALDRRLDWGVGIRPASLGAFSGGGSSKVLKLTGNGLDAGLIWNPGRGPLRVGAVCAGRITTEQSLEPSGSTGPVREAGLIVPSEVTLPTSGSVGASYTWRSSPFWAAHPATLSADLQMYGAARNAVSVESFAEQKIQRSGEHKTLGYHLGSEYEAWPRRLRVRAGTYFEPSRFPGVSGRQHGTGGFEVNLFRLNLFGERRMSFSYAFDGARRYTNHFVSIGFWD